MTPQSAFAGDMSAFNAGNNRIQLGGFGYDNAGNLTGDPSTGPNAIFYDAENRQTSYTKAGVTTNYSYDGSGHRVKKAVGPVESAVTTVFVYNIAGQLIAEYTDAASSGGGGTSYVTQDHLGSTRVVTDSGGNVKARHDYLPFGEEIPNIDGRSSIPGYSANDTTKQRFTGKERDGESGLDYFGVRYYSSPQARFTSADPMLSSGHEEEPQTWNRYSYTLNNPLKYIDPLGLYVFDQYATDEQKKQFNASFEELKKVRDSYGQNSKERKRLDKIIAAYGEPGQGGPTVKFAAIGQNRGDTNYEYRSNGEGRRVNYSITVTFDSNSTVSTGIVAHEGQHVSDDTDALNGTVVRNGQYVTPANLNLSLFQREDRAYEIQQDVARALVSDVTVQGPTGTHELYNADWDKIDTTSIAALKMITNRREIIRDVYGLTASQPGRRITQPRPPRR